MEKDWQKFSKVTNYRVVLLHCWHQADVEWHQSNAAEGDGGSGSGAKPPAASSTLQTHHGSDDMALLEPRSQASWNSNYAHYHQGGLDVDVGAHSGDTSAAQEQTLKQVFSLLSEDLIMKVGRMIDVPRVFVTQMTWNRGVDGKYGAVLVLLGNQVFLNGTEVSKVVRRANDHAVSWKVENNLNLLKDSLRPAGAQIVFHSEYTSFSGLCWCTEKSDSEPSVRLYFGRLIVDRKSDPFKGEHMWSKSEATRISLEREATSRRISHDTGDGSGRLERTRSS
ncbi:hypothetical protein FVE85_8231 [Porphyridium purpureum]|uniref:Uncharacterized protein n=1 Tax=Porphyridium purpureum TaxID=35688 RepID=A0A5J4YJZ3_PORPP|nr:hypothetical protein FVE85_8231 [Porphyridium purpureum]|eukprot:POR3576..scf244_11